MSTGDITKFWMVWNVHGGAPTYQHWSKDAAATEALRLATVNPGKTFVVLSAVDAFRTETAPPQQLKVVKRPPSDSEIPF